MRRKGARRGQRACGGTGHGGTGWADPSPQRCIGSPPPPPPGRPACAQPLSPWRQVPASTAFVTDSNRPHPLWQPPPTACLTASRAASGAPALQVGPSPSRAPRARGARARTPSAFRILIRVASSANTSSRYSTSLAYGCSALSSPSGGRTGAGRALWPASLFRNSWRSKSTSPT